MAHRNEPFFSYLTVVLIIIVISGFTLASFSIPGGITGIPLFLHFHGAVFLGWYVLLLAQMHLIRTRKHDIHKKLGYISILHAIAIIIIGYLVVLEAIHTQGKTIAGRPAAVGAVFPIMDIVNFTIVYTLGIAFRKNAHAHKRFMMFTAILMIDAAMARLVFGLGLPAPLILAFEIALILSVITYDLVRFKRPHWASIVGLILYIGAFAFKLNVEKVSWWPEFIRLAF